MYDGDTTLVEAPPSPTTLVEAPPSPTTLVESPPSPTTLVEPPSSPTTLVEAPPSPTTSGAASVSVAVALAETCASDDSQVTVKTPTPCDDPSGSPEAKDLAINDDLESTVEPVEDCSSFLQQLMAVFWQLHKARPLNPFLSPIYQPGDCTGLHSLPQTIISETAFVQ